MNSMTSDPVPTMQSKLASRLTIFLVVALFLIPVAYYAFEPETAQWGAAGSIRIYESGEKAAAIAELTKILEETKDPYLSIRLGQWLQDDGQLTEAIYHSEQTLSAAVGSGDAQLAMKAILLKANCLIMLKQYKAAMAAVHVGFGEQPPPKQTPSDQLNFYRNGLAYYRGLCRQNLGSAKRDMNAVVRQLDGQKMKEFPISFRGQVAMAAGLLSRYTDQREAAVVAITRRLDSVEAVVDSKQDVMKRELYRLLEKFLPFDEAAYKRAGEARDQARYFVNEIVVLKSVLALLLDELGQHSQAMQLRNEVARSDTTCEQILESLPTERALLGYLDSGATFLDTRGFVCYARQEYQEALRDIDLAILASDTLLKSLDTPIQNSTETIDYSTLRKNSVRNAATLYNHRAQVYEAMKESEKATLDRQRVIELGFEPGSNLF